MPGPEDRAREKIDAMLSAAGWIVQSYSQLNYGAGPGIAITEYRTLAGPADYLLVVNRKAIGAVEAKAEGATLSGVAEQTAKYITNFPDNLPHHGDPLPFAYESTGTETMFRDERDPNPRSRRVFSFHRPEHLLDLVEQSNTLRGRLTSLPPLITENLWKAQIRAVEGLEESLKEDRPRSLIQMATGSGKTYMAINAVYRLIKFAGAKRVLFLVDRRTLGRQARAEFENFITPDDGRKFTELYNLQLLSSRNIDPVNKVVITTIQRLFSMLKGEEFEQGNEEISLADYDDRDEQVEVTYNERIPIEMFDFIIVDECHRSIYGKWRQILEYFDAHLIGLTATPSMQTFGFFNQNLVTEYNHEMAVADGVNVGYDIYRIRTKITEQGSEVNAGFRIDKRDRQTRRVRWTKLDETLVYSEQDIDRSVVAPDQIRTIIQTFRDKLPVDIFPGRTEVPKTLIFAKDDSHAEDIVGIVREEFGKGNEFAKKITYRTTGEKTEDLIASFRNSYFPRIAVTVDMISTGTDIKAIECLLFMRDVKSQGLYEQMKGRGTRVIKPDEIQAVTPDAPAKTHFVIVDAVGVTETDKTDTRPLERKPTVSFNKILNSVASGRLDEDTLMTLAGRLSRLNQRLNDQQRKQITDAADGTPLTSIAAGLLEAVDPDRQMERATEQAEGEPSEKDMKEASAHLALEACKVFDDPNFRETLLFIHKQLYQIIDTVSQDMLLSAGMDSKTAENTVQSFKDFIDSNKDEITALQIIYNQPYEKRHITYDMIKELAASMKRPPYNLNTDIVWLAYERLQSDKVKASPQKLLTDLIALVRFGIGKVDILTPFRDTVDQRFETWLANQARAGNDYHADQLQWLAMIKDHIAANAEMTISDLEYVPFNKEGGLAKANQVFDGQLPAMLEQLNEVLAA